MSTMNKNKEKIYERNPSTDTIRWRYVGEKVDWPNYGRILRITLSKMKMNTQHKVDITDYQDIADCIRSDQVPANHIAEYFTDKKFYEWYKKKYL